MEHGAKQFDPDAHAHAHQIPLRSLHRSRTSQWIYQSNWQIQRRENKYSTLLEEGIDKIDMSIQAHARTYTHTGIRKQARAHQARVQSTHIHAQAQHTITRKCACCHLRFNSIADMAFLLLRKFQAWWDIDRKRVRKRKRVSARRHVQVCVSIHHLTK